MEEYIQPEGEVRQEPTRENNKKKRKTNSYQKKLSPSGRSTMPVRGLLEKEASANSSPLSRN